MTTTTTTASTTTYAIGDRVTIVKGRFAGVNGTVWMVTAKELGVDFDTPLHGDGNAYVRTASVRAAR